MKTEPKKIIVPLALLAIAIFLGYVYMRGVVFAPAPAQVVSTSGAQQTVPATGGSSVLSSTDYDLFLRSYNGWTPKTSYQDDGVVSSGKLAGYHRVAGYQEPDGPGNGPVFMFATKDYQTYVLDSTQSPIQYTWSQSAQTVLDTANIFNKEKVVGVDSIPSNFPLTVPLGGFVLVRDSILIQPDRSQYKKLSMIVSGLDFYQKGLTFQSYDGEDSVVKGGEAHVTAYSDVVAIDAEGLAYQYTFMTKEMYSRRLAFSGKEQREDYNNFYLGSEITWNTTDHYKTYGEAFPGGCGAASTSYVIDGYTANNLTLVGRTKDNLPVYSVSEGADISSAEYERKLGAFSNYPDFLKMNNLNALPTKDEYAAKTPLLVVEDPLGRWVVFGELDYTTPGGCGKPVIYLYPPKATKVSVKIEHPTTFTHDIPTYGDGWSVFAHPDGTLTDLNPSLTGCAAFGSSFGSEYAKSACEKNAYPYLYWSGNTTGIYPKPTGGWIVSKTNLAFFIDSKLTEVGLTNKEKTDMESYWVPKLLGKKTPFYRIAFIQTKEMNNFIPMQIAPKPDSVFRIFLDWEAISTLPYVTPQPQVLDKVQRTGFTVVEWGGLNQ